MAREISRRERYHGERDVTASEIAEISWRERYHDERDIMAREMSWQVRYHGERDIMARYYCQRGFMARSLLQRERYHNKREISRRERCGYRDIIAREISRQERYDSERAIMTLRKMEPEPDLYKEARTLDAGLPGVIYQSIWRRTRNSSNELWKRLLFLQPTPYAI